MDMVKAVAIHEWKAENTKVVTRKVIEALATIPSGVTLIGTWSIEGGAYCIWEGSSPDLAAQVKAYMTEKVPEMKTETKPVVQWYPPGPDLYDFIHGLVS
jgi:hypothetical protein